MNESITHTTNHFSPTASLAATGVKLRQRGPLWPDPHHCADSAETVKHTSADKLYDTWISLLAGAHGLVEINTRLRTDPGRPRASARSACAEQSVVQETDVSLHCRTCDATAALAG